MMIKAQGGGSLKMPLFPRHSACGRLVAAKTVLRTWQGFLGIQVFSLSAFPSPDNPDHGFNKNKFVKTHL